LEAKRTAAIRQIAAKNAKPKNYAKSLQKIDKKYGEPIKAAKLAIEGYNDDIENIKYGGVRSNVFNAVRNQKKDIKIIQPKLEKQLSEQRVAHQLVKNWFSSEDGKMFDMSMIQQRGLYDATMLDADIAGASTRGRAMLEDAGEELINNTFVAVTDLNFFSNKPIADLLKAIGNNMIQVGKQMGTYGYAAALVAASPMFIAAKGIQDGYSVFSKTFLYKLKWNEEIAAEFYNIWGNEEAFNKMDFELEFVGVQYERNVVNAGAFSKKESRAMETVIKKLVARNLDNNFANLQKQYDVFKPKVPIKSLTPVTADIGMKESLKGGERFEILEMREDPNTGRTKWVRVGIATVDKKFVWDNRYNAGEEPENKVIGKDGNVITATAFKTVNNAQVGMFLKQIK
jgi:hypothetical protein